MRTNITYFLPSSYVRIAQPRTSVIQLILGNTQLFVGEAEELNRRQAAPFAQCYTENMTGMPVRLGEPRAKPALDRPSRMVSAVHAA